MLLDKGILCQFLTCTYLKGVRHTVDTLMENVKSLITDALCPMSNMWIATHSHAPKFLRHL